MRRKRNELQPIVSEEQREAAFEEMISGEYSDLYQRKLSDAVKDAVAQEFQMRRAMPNVPAQGMSDERAKARLRRWAQEEQQIRALYPDFDLKREMENPQFIALLRADVPMRQVYELVHLEELKAEAARNAARAISDQMTANVRTRGARPSENGMSAHSAALVKNDVHNLSREDRAEIVRRAQRGETIRF
ncbi:MAG: hypothetical protein IJ955_05420 [Oscillospiraceae bacterium]|nr:hypothetical protein [Oscillospiraceae bacterium]MBR2481550.1 hypothetical protein [Oscillospiraceae bacterium]